MEAPTTVAEQPTKEVPLHKAIEEILVAAGHPNPFFWHTFLHPHALDVKLDFDVRRFLVNRAFEMAIGGVNPSLYISEKVAQD